MVKTAEWRGAAACEMTVNDEGGRRVMDVKTTASMNGGVWLKTALTALSGWRRRSCFVCQAAANGRHEQRKRLRCSLLPYWCARALNLRLAPS